MLTKLKTYVGSDYLAYISQLGMFVPPPGILLRSLEIVSLFEAKKARAPQ